MESSTLEYITAQNCNLTKIGSNLDSKGYGLATRLDFPDKERFSVAILKYIENGKLDELKEKYWRGTVFVFIVV